jgi:hypothetical protein
MDNRKNSPTFFFCLEKKRRITKSAIPERAYVFPVMPTDVEPESQYQVNNNGRTDGKKRSIDKIKSNTAGTQTHSLT